MPQWHAKVRKRLKHIQAVTIASTDGGARSLLLKEHAGRLIPFSSTSFESVDAAKKDAEQEFNIRITDWVELEDAPEENAHIDARLTEVIQKGLVEGLQRSLEIDEAEYERQTKLLSRRFTPAQGRRFKKLLPGTWVCQDHELTIRPDGKWDLHGSDKVRLKHFDFPNGSKNGTWSYTSGTVNFSVPDYDTGGSICAIVHILELDKDQFVFHADPEPVTLTRQKDNPA